MKPRLQIHYEERVRPRLIEELGYANVYQVPKVDKIVINVGLGEAPKNPKLLDSIVEELAAITGQRPVVTRARKAISNFALRAGMPIGAMVTLRQRRMYEFMDRLVSVAIPRIRDFRGLPTRSFDGRGNSHARHQGAVDLPGDRVRPGAEGPWDGHRHLHDGESGRRGPGAVA